MKKSPLLSLTILSLLTFLLFGYAPSANAQVPKKVVVEHFTNTLCGICAFKNPAFFGNLAGNPDVLHLSVHPSSPYPTCILNLHQPSENDARVNYYGLYGSTPRFVINGDNISPAADLSSPSLFSPFTGQTSPVSLDIEQLNYGADSIVVTVTVNTVAANSLGSLRLFVALAEDTIFYAAPNGENEHLNVFRKALSAPEGLSLTLPPVGSSASYTFSAPVSPVWDLSRIFTMAILQEAGSKDLVQAEKGTESCNPDIAPTGLSSFVTGSAVQLSWNPVPGSVGCQVNGGPVPSFGATSIVSGFEVQGTSFPTSILSSGTYNWRLRCACETSPVVVATPFSASNFFVITAPRMREQEELKPALPLEKH